MSVPFEVEEIRDHHYLVRGEEDGDTMETQFVVDPDALEQLGVPDAPAEDVVRVTAEYLLQRQRQDDLPTRVDIEDVAAAYEDFAHELREGLARRAG